MTAKMTDDMMDEMGNEIFYLQNGMANEISYLQNVMANEIFYWWNEISDCLVRNILLPGTKIFIARYEIISVLISN